jgi:hypothetical protein
MRGRRLRLGRAAAWLCCSCALCPTASRASVTWVTLPPIHPGNAQQIVAAFEDGRTQRVSMYEFEPTTDWFGPEDELTPTQFEEEGVGQVELDAEALPP